MKKVLIVESSRMVAQLMRKQIQSTLGLGCVICHDLKEAVNLLACEGDDFFISLVEPNLPDGSGVEVLELMIASGISTVAVTGSYNSEESRKYLGMGAVDYIVKRSPNDMNYLLRVVNRVYANARVKVLVLTNNEEHSESIARMLMRSRIESFTPATAAEAVDTLFDYPEIKLMIMEHTPPAVNAFKLLQDIRLERSMDEVSVIVLSDNGNEEVNPALLKNGANDVFKKCIGREEFLCRVNMNLDMLELIQSTRDKANRDFLTGCYNRLYFYSKASEVLEAAKRKGAQPIIAMFDLDHFKKVNDTYGHDTGDTVIKMLANLLSENFDSTDIVARFGGEEFCVLTQTVPFEFIKDCFDEIRLQIAASHVDYEGATVKFTSSIGVCAAQGKDLNAMVTIADEMLYKAKNNGRNQVQISY